VKDDMNDLFKDNCKDMERHVGRRFDKLYTTRSFRT
jgi:hypothetical protein